MIGEQKQEYILGIDLGPNSLGWALIKASKDGTRYYPQEIKDAGVRIFEAGVANLEDFSKDAGKGVQRRMARSSRVRLDHANRRKSNLFHILQRNGLLPKDNSNKQKSPGKKNSLEKRMIRQGYSEIRNGLLNDMDFELQRKWKEKLKAEGATEKEVNQIQNKLFYLMRARALAEKMEKFEIGRIIYHLAHRRGFESAGRLEDEKEHGIYTKETDDAIREMEKHHVTTIGSLLSLKDINCERLRDRKFLRSLYREEFEQIWKRQAVEYPDLLTNDLKVLIGQVIFSQRPLKDVNPGFCPLEKDQPRAPKASLEFQRLRYMQKLADLEIVSPQGEVLMFSELPEEKKERLIQEFDCCKEVSFERIGQILYPESVSGCSFKLQRRNRNEMLGNRTAAAFIEALGNRWHELSDDKKCAMVDSVRQINHFSSLHEYLQNVFSLSPEEAEKTGKVKLEEGYAEYSRKAILNILPDLKKVRLNTSIAKKYGERPIPEMRFLPPLNEFNPYLNNPIVKRSLSELRRVMNSIIRDLGKPALIRIEMARELKQSKEQRQITSESIDLNESVRKQAADEIISKDSEFASFQIDDAKEEHIEKWMLWREANRTCPYCQEGIEGSTLFGSGVEVDHIIPRSRLWDNSFTNKVVCHAKCNREKGDKTPAEFLDGKKYEDMLKVVAGFHSIKEKTIWIERPNKPLKAFNISVKGGDAKKNRFKQRGKELDEFLERFRNNQLNDTAYSAKEAKRYLSWLYGNDRAIEGANGKATSILRFLWGLPKKNRDDHRHHAEDAILIALTSRSIFQQLSEFNQKFGHLNRKETKIKLHEGYRIESGLSGLPSLVSQVLSKTIVSHRIDKKINKKLHDDNPLGPRFCEDGKVRRLRAGEEPNCFAVRISLQKFIEKVKKSKKPDKLDKLLGQVYESSVREAIKAKINSHSGDLAKLKEDQPILKNGKRIKYLRIIEASHSVGPIGHGLNKRYVDAKSNHHIEYFGLKGPDGKIKKYGGTVISHLDAMTLARRHKPIWGSNIPEGANFLFSLAKNEALRDKKSGQVFIVQKINKGDKRVFLIEHNDARQKKDIPIGARGFYPNQLVPKFQKILITALGQIRDAND